MGKSTYARNKTLDFWLYNGIKPTAPGGTAVHLSLHTADPGTTGASELSGNGYARQNILFGTAASSGSISNTNSGEFGPNTTTNWGTITHIGLWDAVTTGNFLYGGTCTSRTVSVGEKVTFAVSAVTATET